MLLLLLHLKGYAISIIVQNDSFSVFILKEGNFAYSKTNIMNNRIEKLATQAYNDLHELTDEKCFNVELEVDYSDDSSGVILNHKVKVSLKLQTENGHGELDGLEILVRN
jgi:hypothetical protein